MREQVALLVHGTALHRDVVPQAGERRLEAFAAIDDDEFGSASPRLVRSWSAARQAASLAAHVPDREHHLLAVAPDAERDQQRDSGGLAIQTNLDHRAVENQSVDVVAGEIALLPGLPGRAGLLPGAADDVLADVAFEQLGQRPTHAAGVHAGEIGLGDQRFGPAAEPLVGRQ